MPSINEQLATDSKEYGASSTSNYFKFEAGDNRIRILTAGEVIATHFFGKGQKAVTCIGMEKGCPFHGDGALKDKDGKEKRPSIKYTCYIVNVNDKNEKVQLADLPYSVIKQIGDYQQNTDYSFDSFPMPYDITVKYDPESNSPNDMYKVIASPKRTEVNSKILDSLKTVMEKVTPKQNVQKKKAWQREQFIKEGVISDDHNAWIEKTNAEARASGEPELPTATYPEGPNPEDIPF